MFGIHKTMHALGVLTLVQLWWISIWGIAYLAVGHLSGTSKLKEFSIYAIILTLTFVIFQRNPWILEKL